MCLDILHSFEFALLLARVKKAVPPSMERNLPQQK
jgi:hypothetical protein